MPSRGRSVHRGRRAAANVWLSGIELPNSEDAVVREASARGGFNATKRIAGRSRRHAPGMVADALTLSGGGNIIATNTVQRAFELARQGSCMSIPEIKRQLHLEGFSLVEDHLRGRTIAADLKKIWLQRLGKVA